MFWTFLYGLKRRAVTLRGVSCQLWRGWNIPAGLVRSDSL